MNSRKQIPIVFLISIVLITCTERNKDQKKVNNSFLQKVEAISLDDFSVIKEGTNSKIDMEEYKDDIVKDLGEPLTEKVIKKGDSKEWDIIKYTFDGIEINFYRGGIKFPKWILEIYIFKPMYKTPRGIGVGSYLDDVFKTYGEVRINREKNDTWIEYRMEPKNEDHPYLLTFLIENNLVKGIIINVPHD